MESYDKLPRYSAIVEPLLPSKFDHQSLPEILWTHLHHLSVRLLRFNRN